MDSFKKIFEDNVIFQRKLMDENFLSNFIGLKWKLCLIFHRHNILFCWGQLEHKLCCKKKKLLILDFFLFILIVWIVYFDITLGCEQLSV